MERARRECRSDPLFFALCPTAIEGKGVSGVSMSSRRSSFSFSALQARQKGSSREAPFLPQKCFWPGAIQRGGPCTVPHLLTVVTVLKNASANPVTPAMAHGSKDAEGRLLGPSAATQRGYLQDRAPGAFRTDRPPVRSPMRRPATAPLVHTAHEMRGVHKRVCIW